MHMKFLRFAAILLPIALLLASCGTSANARKDAPALDYAAFVERLRGAGAAVEQEGDIAASPFSLPLARSIRVNGQHVAVYEYQSASAAQADAARLSPDGGTYTTRDPSGAQQSSIIIDWESRPRWYQAGRLIILYVGIDSAMATLLERQLGAPFAGQGHI
jgi:hypothetical protein